MTNFLSNGGEVPAEISLASIVSGGIVFGGERGCSSEIAVGGSATTNSCVGDRRKRESSEVDGWGDMQFEHGPIDADITLNSDIELAIGEEIELRPEIENASGGVRGEWTGGDRQPTEAGESERVGEAVEIKDVA